MLFVYFFFHFHSDCTGVYFVLIVVRGRGNNNFLVTVARRLERAVHVPLRAPRCAGKLFQRLTNSGV